jgi:GT2 family glycosyltransferase
MAKVSVVIPTYNRATFIAETIASTLQQALGELEVIVLDDGSTDSTEKVVRQIADPRLIYVRQENQGATAAFNAGVRKSTGDYLSILGDDDYYLEDGLVPLLELLEDNPDVGVAAGGYYLVGEKGKFIQEVQPWIGYPELDTKTWLLACPVLLQASLIRREWFDKIGGFSLDIKGPQDWDFGLRLAHAGCKMEWIKEPVFNYRLHGDNSVKRDVSITRNDIIKILNRFFTVSGLEPELQEFKNRALGFGYLRCALRAYGSKQYTEAREDIRMATESDPSLLKSDGQMIFDQLTAYAKWPLNNDPLRFIQETFDNLPDELSALKKRKREAIGTVAMAVFFATAERRKWREARKAFYQGISNDPSWLKNRGVISLGLESILGSRLMNLVRNAF